MAVALEPVSVLVFGPVSWAGRLGMKLEVELEAVTVLELHTMLPFLAHDVHIRRPSLSRRMSVRRQETKRK